jgi:hypothetical protein
MAGRDTEATPPTPRWIRVIGIALIAVVWLPLAYALGGLVLVSLGARRARSEADQARGAIRAGASLSELVRTTSAPVGADRALSCYEAACLDPAGLVLAKHGDSWSGPLVADGPVEHFESAADLVRIDNAACRRVKVTYCGRPWMTLTVEMDGDRRVGRVGVLGVSAD